MSTKFSSWSIVLLISGILIGTMAFFISPDLINNLNFLLTGILIYFSGLVTCLVAFIKKELGKKKYISAFSLIPLLIGVIYFGSFIGGL